jgi:cytochrome P450
MSSPAPRPAHVPPERVVDFDYGRPPGHEEDVHLAWKQLQDSGVPELFWTPHHGGHWVAARAELIDEMQLDHTRFSHQSVTIPSAPDAIRLVPLEFDPPEHTPFRALLSPAFGPRQVQALEHSVRTLSTRLIDAVLPAGQCDFVESFAKQLPIEVFLHLVDLPLEDRPFLLSITEASVRPRTPADSLWSREQLAGYIGRWIAERRARPGPDLLSKMVNAQVNGRDYTPAETFGLMINVIFGGLDTVAASMGFIACHLAQQPALRQRLAAEPALIPVAVEECLRRFGIPNTARVVTHDMDYRGVQLKAGEQILLPKVLHGLDEQRYERPLEIDLSRPSSRHAAFGDGPHRCVGAGLARMELRVFLETWLAKIPAFTLTPGDRPRTSSGHVNGMLYLPLSWQV